MTRGEFVLQRLKDELAMYRVLFVVCVVAEIAALALMAYATFTGGIEGFLTFAGSALFFVFWGMACKGRRDSLAEIYREVGDDPAGIVDRRDFPKQTVLALVQLQRPTKEYLQLTIAYGICAVMLIAGAVLIYWVASWERELIFIGLGSLLLLGGFWLAVLTFQAARNWRTSKQLDEIHREEPASPESGEM